MTTTPTIAERNAIGTAALVVGVVAVLLGTVVTFLQPIVVRGGGVGAITALATVRLVLDGLLGIVAFVLGLIGALRRRHRIGAAVAGLTIGALLIFSAITALASSAIYSVL